MRKTTFYFALLNKKDKNIAEMFTHNYASLGGKSKIMKIDDNFCKNDKKNIIHNGHVQYITDFNLIYDDINNIRVYQIGTLYTKRTKTSYEISSSENYNGEKNTQNIEFFLKPIKIKSNIHYIKESIPYFEKEKIKEEIENKDEYKEMFQNVIKELKSKNIQYKIAETNEELEFTGLNILRKMTKNKDKDFMNERPVIVINDEK